MMHTPVLSSDLSNTDIAINPFKNLQHHKSLYCEEINMATSNQSLHQASDTSLKY